MELTDLRMILVIAEEGSITRAAERLGFVQSNVTARLGKLEAELGVPLFYRLPRGVVLTEKGTILYEYAQQIVGLTEDAIKAVRGYDSPSGTLTIGVVESVTCGRFMELLSNYQTEYPNVSLTLVTGLSTDLLDKLLSYKLDGAFLVGELPSSGVIVEYQSKDELKWLSHTASKTIPNLTEVQWVVSPKGCPFRKALEQWLHSEGIRPASMLEIGSLETLLSCVRAGMASTLLPASVLTGAYKDLGTYPIPEEFRQTITSLVQRPSKFSNNAFQLFADMVRIRGL